MSRNGETTRISLGLHPTKKAQFYCHICRKHYEGYLEFGRFKILNRNGSCKGQRTYCESCMERMLYLERLVSDMKRNENIDLPTIQVQSVV